MSLVPFRREPSTPPPATNYDDIDPISNPDDENNNDYASPASSTVSSSALVPASSRQMCPYCQRPFFFTQTELLMMLQRLRGGGGGATATTAARHQHDHNHQHYYDSDSPDGLMNVGNNNNNNALLSSDDDDFMIDSKKNSRRTMKNNDIDAINSPSSLTSSFATRLIKQRQQKQRQRTLLDPHHINHMTPVTNITPDFFEASYSQTIPRQDRRRLEMLTPTLGPRVMPRHDDKEDDDDIDASTETTSTSLVPVKNGLSTSASSSRQTSEVLALLPPPIQSSAANEDDDGMNSSPKLLVSKVKSDDDAVVSSSTTNTTPNASFDHPRLSQNDDDVFTPKEEQNSTGQQQPPPPPSFFEHFFQEVAQLGRGSFGSVTLCRHVIENETLGLYAVKKVPVGDDVHFLHRALSEVRVLQNLRRHPNCIQYFYSWVEMAKLCDFGPVVRSLFILQEFCDMGTLESFMEKSFGKFLPDDGIWCLFLQALDGLAHLHNQGILHRDIKVENMLLSKDNEYYTQKWKKKNLSSKTSKKGDASDNNNNNTSSPFFSSHPLPHERPPISMWPRLMLADFGTSALMEQKQKMELVLAASMKNTSDDDGDEHQKDDGDIQFVDDPNVNSGALIPISTTTTTSVKTTKALIQTFLINERKRRRSTTTMSANDDEEINNNSSSRKTEEKMQDNDCIPSSLPPRERTGATGTQEYMAPELFIIEEEDDENEIKDENENENENKKNEEENSSKEQPSPKYKYSHSVQSDLYSLGVCLHYLAFEGTFPIARRRCRLSACRTKRPPEMIQLIEILLQPNPMHRPESCDVILNDQFCIKLKQRLGMLFDSTTSPTNNNKNNNNHSNTTSTTATRQKLSSINNSDNDEKDETSIEHQVDVLSGTYGSAKDLRPFYKNAREQHQLHGCPVDVNDGDENTRSPQFRVKSRSRSNDNDDDDDNTLMTPLKSRPSSSSKIKRTPSLFDASPHFDEQRYNDNDDGNGDVSPSFSSRKQNNREKEQPNEKTGDLSPKNDTSSSSSSSSAALLKASLIMNAVLIGVGGFVLLSSENGNNFF